MCHIELNIFLFEIEKSKLFQSSGEATCIVLRRGPVKRPEDGNQLRAFQCLVMLEPLNMASVGP